MWLFFNTHVYIIADKYGIAGLKKRAWRNITNLDNDDDVA